MDRVLSIEYEKRESDETSVLLVVDTDTYEVINKLYGEEADDIYGLLLQCK